MIVPGLMMRKVSIPCTVVALATAALVLAGCQPGFEINTPTDLTSAMSFLEIPVEPGSNGVDAFEVNQTEYTRITLVGLVGADPKRPLDVQVGMRTGLFLEDGCITSNQNLDTKVRPSFVVTPGKPLEALTRCEGQAIKHRGRGYRRSGALGGPPRSTRAIERCQPCASCHRCGERLAP